MTYTLEQVQSTQNKMVAKLGDFYSGFDKVLGKLSIKLPAPMELGKQAVDYSAKQAMKFDQSMTKINMVTRLDEKGLDDLKNQLKRVARENRADIEVVPAGFEKIVSQVGNTDTAIQILEASIKGSKAGFTNLNTVSDALTQSLAAIGKEGGSAQDVLDVFFAAQRTGGSSFEDIAQYMPSLISGASGMGFNFKEAAGAFAFMTSKGQTAEQAAGMMQSAFTALGNTDVQSKLQNIGVDMTDQEGNLRSMVDIFGQLSTATAGMGSENKTSLLESLGITDPSALNAFSILTSDMLAFQQVAGQTGNATGETDAALDLSSNSMQKATDLWSQLHNIGNSLGTIMLPIINAGFSVASGVLDGLSLVVDTISGFMSGWFVELQNGNPAIWGITAAVTALIAIMNAANILAGLNMAATMAMNLWDGIAAGGKMALAVAQRALNLAFSMSPIGMIVMGVGALAGIIAVCWNKFEGFRGVIMGCWEAIKGFGNMLKDYVINRIQGMLSGISGLGEALLQFFKGNFAASLEVGKRAVKDMTGITAAAQLKEDAGKLGTLYDKGHSKGVENFRESQENKKAKQTPELTFPGNTNNFNLPDIKVPEPVIPANAGTTTTTGKNKPNKKLFAAPQIGIPENQSNVIDLNEPVTNRRESSVYTAAIEKLSPSLSAQKTQTGQSKMMETARKMAATAAIPLAMSVAASPLADNRAGEGMSQADQYGITQGMSRQGYGDSPARTIQIDRVCDNIIINVANTDGQGTGEIKDQIINTLNELLMYEL